MTLPTGQLHVALTPAASEKLLMAAGYTVTEVGLLHDSGFLALDFEAIDTEQLFDIVGSNPANVFGADLNPHDYRRLAGGGNGIMLVDTYTGAILRPAALTELAMFGRRGTWSGTSVDLPEVNLSLRWRHHSIPSYLVSNTSDLDVVEKAFNARGVRGTSTFFRGQTRHFSISRSDVIRKWLYGNEPAREPSLVTAASRHRFPYVVAERSWHSIVADIDYRLTGFTDRKWWIESRYESVYVGETRQIADWHRVSTMAMAQHYGVPTYGLDVTRSIRMAFWFATHEYVDRHDYVEYLPHIVASADPVDWPVIYVLQSPHSHVVGTLDLPATRPQRQEGVFVNGGWGVHSNACADDVVAVLVLSPEAGCAGQHLEDVFPPAQQDPFLAELVRIKRKVGPSHPLYIGAGLKHVYEFM